MRSLRVALTVLALPVGIFAGDYCTPAAWRWERAAADAASYARNQAPAEADDGWQAYINARALQILAGMEPE